MDKCNGLNFQNDEGSFEEKLKKLQDFMLSQFVLRDEEKERKRVELLKPEKVAEILQMSKNSLIRLRQNGEIGYCKCLRKVYYRWEDIEEYINCCRRRDIPKEKIEKEIVNFDYKDIKKEKNIGKKT